MLLFNLSALGNDDRFSYDFNRRNVYILACLVSSFFLAILVIFHMD